MICRVWILHNGQMHWLICAVSDDLLYVDAVLGQDWLAVCHDDPGMYKYAPMQQKLSLIR